MLNLIGFVDYEGDGCVWFTDRLYFDDTKYSHILIVSNK